MRSTSPWREKIQQNRFYILHNTSHVFAWCKIFFWRNKKANQLWLETLRFAEDFFLFRSLVPIHICFDANDQSIGRPTVIASPFQKSGIHEWRAIWIFFWNSKLFIEICMQTDGIHHHRHRLNTVFFNSFSYSISLLSLLFILDPLTRSIPSTRRIYLLCISFSISMLTNPHTHFVHGAAWLCRQFNWDSLE